MDRRELLKGSAAAVASILSPVGAEAAVKSVATAGKVERWGVFELELNGPSHGNPFVDVTLTAHFTQEHRTVAVKGFYDGDGLYRVRFMPDAEGVWSYTTASSAAELNGKTGHFACAPASEGNRGPVTTANRFHFIYADGSPYSPFGTTTYSYLFATDTNAAVSLEGMRGYFNKSRVCVLPKPLGNNGPELLPFPRSGEGKDATNDYTHFNPAYFRLVEKRILELQGAGIEADCILFHPYDAWGYKAMPNGADDFYLRYVVARFAAYRNVWWSIANEYDLVKTKSMPDWDRYFRIVQAEDPYGHLRSIHHSQVIYDHSRPWCTHASLQSWDFEKSAARREAWNKPIVYDEIQYEGDVDRRWGNLAAEEMVRRFWLATVRGSYASHGEVFRAEETGPHAHEPSWSDAGRLRGDSAAKIRFLHEVIAKYARTGLNEFENSYYLSAGKEGELYLWYFDYHRPSRYDFPLPNTAIFEAVLLDPWERKETKLQGSFTGKSRVDLPGKPYQAILFRKTAEVKGKPTGQVAGPEVMD
ncbi:DUF5060 domain-containing protein [Terriglobus tenax]|uniref:DUF5060 domain-containing protein n=1 Tax=Terriglobus tenax TaxID=1111115 RepID=UPI0021E0EB45|nr:DUF5060 domain-containing protein [Terriglobus tenax]